MFHRPCRRPRLVCTSGLFVTATLLLSGCLLPPNPGATAGHLPAISSGATTAQPSTDRAAGTTAASPAQVAATTSSSRAAALHMPPLRPVEAEPQAPATQLQPRPLGPIESLLSHADRVRALSSAELSAEVARANEAAAAAPGNAYVLLQQAITLAQTRSSADLARALAVSQRVAADTNPNSQPVQALARLLVGRYHEQRRVEDDRDRQAQQVKDAQRRIDQLNDRLEALRAIERSFGRPAPANGSPSRTPN